MIVLDGAHRGVELGFWTTRVFAQDLAGASFVQAAAPERADLVTTGFADYSLLVHAGNYALSVNGAPVFSGALRDYSPSGVTVAGVAVYAQPDFLFFGDDTGSAAARMHLRSVSVAPVPEPSIAAMMLAGLGAVGYAIRRRRHRQGGTARPGS
ncbi:MAG: PEP-CTERM sorting domain-containing protein [Burkholderiales bacterium]|nr:PEP-CTERM sorting domain-containing protein [Burkholderiales bacterium]